MQRVLGIACGVLLLELTAILVYPRSATQEAVAKMGTALEKLAELNRMTWVHGPWESPSQKPGRRGQLHTAAVPQTYTKPCLALLLAGP